MKKFEPCWTRKQTETKENCNDHAMDGSIGGVWCELALVGAAGCMENAANSDACNWSRIDFSSTASTIEWAKRRIGGLTVRGLCPAIAAQIDEAELTQLIQRVSANSNGRILHAPSVTHFDGQSIQMDDKVKRPFVTGVDPQADGRMQPVISIVEEGLSFVIKSKSSDDDSITLDFNMKVSSIGKVSYANLPIRSSSSEKEGITVQVPATEQYELSSTVKLAVGESVLLAIPHVFDNEPGAEDGKTVLVSLTPRIVTLKE